MATRILNRRAVGVMIALDAILGNVDRHENNIIAEPLESGLRIWAIDFGNADAGIPGLLADRDLEVSKVTGRLEGLQPDLLAGEVHDAVAAMCKLSASLIREAAQEACELGRQPKIDRLEAALKHRMVQGHDVVNGYLAALRNPS